MSAVSETLTPEEETLNEAIGHLGWDDSSIVSVLMEYINNQERSEAFRDFILTKAHQELNQSQD